MSSTGERARSRSSRVLLLGSPVSHSLSPGFQNAGFAAAGLALRYEVQETAEAELGAVVASIRRGELEGANVTVPHKRAVVPHVDRLSYAAGRVGAVNTLVRTVHGVEGHNTDVAGLRRSLQEWLGGETRGKTAVVLGAGGTTRAALVALDQLEFAHVVVVNRTAERGEALVAELRDEVLTEVSCCALEVACGASAPEAVSGADVVVHTTSLGVGTAPGESGWASAMESWGALPWKGWAGRVRALDVCYGREGTPFCAVATREGVPCTDGLDMLLYQGVESFVLWTSTEAPEAEMRRALHEAAGREVG